MSEIRAGTLSDTAGTGPAELTGQHASKAWGNINGASAPPAARESFNLSSVTDVGAGDQDMNFTSSFASANHAPTAGAYISGSTVHFWVESLLTGSFTFRTQNWGGTVTDGDILAWAVAGDLA